jgi:hypothetical protein
MNPKAVEPVPGSAILQARGKLAPLIALLRKDALLCLAAYFILIVAFLAASIPYAVKASENGSAFVRWRNQIEQLFSTENIYLRHAYPNPPIMGVVLYPLTALPPLAGALAWYYLKAALALLALLWAFELVQAPERPFPGWAKLVVALLILRPMLGDLSHGNVNLFILFLVLAALMGYCRGRDFFAGAVLGLAIACKVTPVLFVPYFLWKRAGKVLAGTALGLVLFLEIVPAALLGWERNHQLLCSWTRQMAQPYLEAGQVLYTEHANQSLPAVVLRLTTANPSFSTYIDEQKVPLTFHNLVEWDPAVATWLVRCCLVLFMALVVWACRTPTSERRGWRLPAEFSLVLVGMLLFSERTWKHHCVVLLLPFAVLVYLLAGEWKNDRQRAWLAAALGLAVLVFWSTSTGLLKDSFAKQMQVYGGNLWANVLLAAALLGALMASREREPALSLGESGEEP